MKLTIKQHEWIAWVYLCCFFFPLNSKNYSTALVKVCWILGCRSTVTGNFEFGETMLWRAGLWVILRFLTVWRVVPPTPSCSESTIFSSLALSTLTLYNHHYHPSPEFFIFANWIFALIKCWPSIPLYPQPLVTVPNLLSLMILPFPDDSYK